MSGDDRGTAANYPFIQHTLFTGNYALPWNHVSCIYLPMCGEGFIHTHTHTFSYMLFILYYMWVMKQFYFHPTAAYFYLVSYILLSSSKQRRHFPSLTQSFDPDVVILTFLKFYLASTPPTHWPSSVHLPHHQLVNRPVSASFIVKQRGSGWCLGRCLAKPNRLSTTSCKTAIIVCGVLILCLCTSLDL